LNTDIFVQHKSCSANTILDHTGLSLPLANPLTYLLTPWSRVLLEKLPIIQLLTKFRAFYGTRKFITVFARYRYCSLSWARRIHSTPSHLISLRYVL